MKKLLYILTSFGLTISSTISLISCDSNNTAMSGGNSLPNGGEGTNGGEVEKPNPEQNSKLCKPVKIGECELEDLDVFANNETDWKTINKTYTNEIENVKKI